MFPAEKNTRIERVQFALRATGVKPEAGNPLRSGIHTRGYLPHVKREGASYFVTFRLADSLPKEVLLKIQARRAEGLQRLSAGKAAGVSEAREAIERDYRRTFERYLDQSRGECWLRRAGIA